MCGRFALQSSSVEMTDYLGVNMPDLFTPRFNIAPTTPVLAQTDQELTFFSWGLVPSWSKDVNIGNRMFNARSETVAAKPSFRNAFKRRRCLVPASGFYEWKAEANGKQPYFCHLERPLFCFAGIWEHWSDSMGNELQSCAILTRDSSGSMRSIHDRMPAILLPAQEQLWLDSEVPAEEALRIIAPFPDELLDAYTVSRKVNKVSENDASLIEEFQYDDSSQGSLFN